LPSAGLPSFCRAVSSSLDDLSLVASAGTSINSPGEDWSFLQGHFARVPFNVGKVGQVAASRHPILVEDVAAQNDWIVRPEWAKREEIRSFAGHPLVFRDKLLGVIAVFSRQHLGQQEFTWLGLFANQAALAIANACAEDALQSSERNLSLMINAIPAIIGVMRADGTPIYGNQGVTDYNGLAMEDILKEGFRTRVFHPEDMEKLHEERRLAFSRPVPFENELRALGKDGKYRWFLFRYKPLLDESGKIDRWYMAATDIEDRKKAEEALQSSERNLSLMINVIPTLAWSTSSDGSVDFLNQPWLHYTGLSLEQGLGWGWTAAIHPDDLSRLADYWRSILHTGEPGEIEARFRRFDGEYRWFLFRANALRDKSGTIVRWYGINIDIDDRKRAEAQVEQAYLRLAEAQQLSKTGSFITDLLGDDHNWSEEAFRIFEFDPEAKVSVELIRNTIHPED